MWRDVCQCNVIRHTYIIIAIMRYANDNVLHTSIKTITYKIINLSYRWVSRVKLCIVISEQVLTAITLKKRVKDN